MKEEKTEHKEGSNDTADKKQPGFAREMISWIILFIIACGIALVINRFILANTTVPTGSMEPTIMAGDRLFGFRLSYKFSDPERGDIIIFKFPDNEEENYIKRIIGLPNETVEIKHGVTYVNGEILDESEYLTVTPLDLNFGPFEVPEDSYFVMGDNRNNSWDARFWKNTYVHKDKIVGKAVLKYYRKIERLS